MKIKPEILIDTRAVLGEAPFWDYELHKLWWIDSIREWGDTHSQGTDLHLYDPSTGIDRKWTINIPIGCAIPTDDGRIILTLKDYIAVFNSSDSTMSKEIELETHLPKNRLNDGKCDAKGRLWFGSMYTMNATFKRNNDITGSFYSYDADGLIKKHFGNLGIFNGLSWSPDNKKLYYSDTTQLCVCSYDFDLESGRISNKQVIIDYEHINGAPDGMTTDADGMLWVAEYGAGKVARWNPYNGKRLFEIEFPCSRITCPTFGGEDLDTLYVTSSSFFMRSEEKQKEPASGALFAVKTDVKGLIQNKFKTKIDKPEERKQ